MRVSGSHHELVAASPAACSAVLLDLAAYAQWYPGVRDVEVLAARSGATARLHLRTGLPVLAEIECVLHLEPRGPDRLEPTMEDGPVRVDGRGWTFEAAPNACTRVGLELTAEMSVPGGFLTERLVGGKARHFLIEAPVVALKRRVEAIV